MKKNKLINIRIEEEVYKELKAKCKDISKLIRSFIYDFVKTNKNVKTNQNVKTKSISKNNVKTNICKDKNVKTNEPKLDIW